MAYKDARCFLRGSYFVLSLLVVCCSVQGQLSGLDQPPEQKSGLFNWTRDLQEIVEGTDQKASFTTSDQRNPDADRHCYSYLHSVLTLAAVFSAFYILYKCIQVSMATSQRPPQHLEKFASNTPAKAPLLTTSQDVSGITVKKSDVALQPRLSQSASRLTSPDYSHPSAAKPIYLDETRSFRNLEDFFERGYRPGCQISFNPHFDEDEDDGEGDLTNRLDSR